MSSGNELPTNPYSDILPTNTSPKPSEGRRRTVLYVMYIVVTVAIMFVAPQTAKIVTIAAWLLTWAIFNTRKNDVPALAGGWTSFSIFVITVLASWITNGTMRQSHVQDFRHVQWGMRSIAQSLDDFHKSHNHYPESLADVLDENVQHFDLEDPWGRQFQYRTEQDNYRVASLGRDGLSGGVGIDTDWSYDSTKELGDGRLDTAPDIPLPLGQFLFDTPSSTSILIIAVWMCLMAGHGAREEAQGVTQITRSMIFTACITTLIVAAVSTFLSLFLIAASQSGH